MELEWPPRNNNAIARRFRDITASWLGLAVFWPVLVLIAAIVMIDSPVPVFYKQKRVGYRGHLFALYKFRTMVVGMQELETPDFQDRKFELLKRPGRDPRITKMGWILRRSSLDELPQLLNVAKGEMSLVGPRPEMPRTVDTFPPAYHLRHETKPGLTGLAQVNGLADITYHEKVMYDLAYVQKQSFSLDLDILLRTVRLVLGGKGR